MVEGVEANDTLLRVDGLDVTNVAMGTVIDALRGTPGTTRTLLLERAGKRITVQATVVRLP
jgi:C-terminal processing protease CtpA/Prc